MKVFHLSASVSCTSPVSPLEVDGRHFNAVDDSILNPFHIKGNWNEDMDRFTAFITCRQGAFESLRKAYFVVGKCSSWDEEEIAHTGVEQHINHSLLRRIQQLCPRLTEAYELFNCLHIRHLDHGEEWCPSCRNDFADVCECPDCYPYCGQDSERVVCTCTCTHRHLYDCSDDRPGLCILDPQCRCPENICESRLKPEQHLRPVIAEGLFPTPSKFELLSEGFNDEVAVLHVFRDDLRWSFITGLILDILARHHPTHLHLSLRDDEFYWRMDGELRHEWTCYWERPHDKNGGLLVFDADTCDFK
jgi:hypothetical protein